MRILLAEDDASQAESIKDWLEIDGYSVDWVERGDASGDDILKCIREQHLLIPVIFITAKDHIHDRVEGLDLGANDYLVKPFNLEELSARIRAQLRQSQKQTGAYLCFADLKLDPNAKTVLKAGETVNLTAKEFQILYKLMQNPNHIVTREQLEESLYAWGEEIESNAIEVFIYQIRKKIGSQLIKTIRGLGYRMNLG